MEELIEKYLDKFIEYHSYNDTRQYYNDEEFKEREEGIKKELREIIKNNRNHMLRDSFICYMTDHIVKKERNTTIIGLSI